MAQESIGTARLDIVVDTTQFDTAIAAAKRGTSGMSQAAQADYAKLTAAERRRVDALVNQANTVDYNRKQQILYNAVLRDVPTSILDELKTKLAATGTAAAVAGKQLNQYGMTAAQQAAALRGVPAQMTDIIVSLQGGQQPLTVLLQQGGQLKDMFGGVVPAARALGGALMGLINPYTLTAAGVAALALAWAKGSSEAQSFREALILSGNAAGLTADNLVSLAHGIGEITGSHSRAVQALNAVTASGKLSGSALRDVAIIAAEMQRATGTEIEKTVDAFAKLGKDPVAAVVELNERYGILTGAIYAQVQALAEQGRAQEAVELVARQAAVELTGRTAAQKENLGTLESAWNKLGAAAAWAWDKMLDIGREDSVDEKIRVAEREVRQRAENIRIAAEGGATIGDKEKAGLRNAQALVDSLRSQKKEAEDAAKAQAEQLRINREAIQAREKVTKLIEDGASKAEKRRKELEKLDGEIAKAKKGDSPLSASEIKAARDAVERKYADKGGSKPYTDDGATRLLAEYAQAEAALRAQLVTQEKLGAWEKRRIEFEQQVSDLKTKKTLTADQQSLLAQESQLRVALEKNVAAEQAVRLAQETARVEVMRASLSSSREVEQRQYDDQLASVGMGDRAQEELRARQAIVRDYQRQLDQAARDLTTGKISGETYQAETALLGQHLQQRLQMQQSYFDEVRKAQGDWKNGATSAMQNYLDSASDVAGQTKVLFSNAFQGMEDAIVKFVTTGKLSFKDFATSVLADLARIAARQAIVGMVGSLVGSLASGITAGASYQGMGGAATGSVEGMSGAWGAVAGARASGGPTAANSLYRVNELGPELYSEGGQTYLMSGANGGYVTPLKSSVPGAGSAPGAAPSISVQVNVTSDGNDERKGSGESEMGDRLADGIVALVRSEITRSHKPGGVAWNARNGRA
ncbi:phage tail tape measure protein [Achromobacter marplatensis]|uniref:Phage tail tape measure protein n=1 Tax=Achromobacter marplatensis TaxID=470868 RepID=A0AA43B3M7_9BURK|nr:phage tail tape measure protein [Achromobacter marplatensis]MDH2052849.1 phage tail tape measure protein [Achromobacter marplatensis]